MQALIERGMTALFSLRGGRLALPIILGLLVVIFFGCRLRLHRQKPTDISGCVSSGFG